MSKWAEPGSAAFDFWSGDLADSLKNDGGSIWFDSTLINRVPAT